MTNLQRFQNNNGIEIVIDTQTGESFASQSATARMCDVSETAIRKFLTSNQISIQEAKIPTATGFKTSNLLSEDGIMDCLAKYKPDMLKKFAKIGLRAFLHKLAGYEVSSTAIALPEQQPLQLPPSDVRVTNLVQTLTLIGFEINNPRFNQSLKDMCGDILGLNQNALLSNEKWCGVVERAEQLGYSVELITRFRSALGRFVSSSGDLTFKQENRLCNGTERSIKLYLVCDDLDVAIKEYMDAKVLSN